MLRGGTAHLFNAFRGGSLRILQQGFDQIFSNEFSISDEIWILELHVCTFWDVTPSWSPTLFVIGNSCTVHMVLCTPERIWGWSSLGCDQTLATTAVIPGIFLHPIYFQETWGLAGPASAAASFPVSDADCKKALLGWDSPLELGTIHMSPWSWWQCWPSNPWQQKANPNHCSSTLGRNKPTVCQWKKINLRKTWLGGKVFSCPELCLRMCRGFRFVFR